MFQIEEDPQSEFKEEWESALRLLVQNDGSGAVFIFRRLASAGVSKAILQLGRLYEFGSGEEPTDLDEAIKWYRRAIEDSDQVPAHAALARIYVQNKQLDPDYAKARVHLEILEDLGLPCGAFGLGMVHMYGDFAHASAQRSKEYFEYAAARGHLGARLELAKLEFKQNRLTGFLNLIRVSYEVRKAMDNGIDNSRLGIEYTGGVDNTVTLEEMKERLEDNGNSTDS